MRTIIFIAAGLFVGIAGGSFIGGTREKGVILERMAAEKAAAEALHAEEPAQESHPTGEAEASEGGAVEAVAPGSQAGDPEGEEGDHPMADPGSEGDDAQATESPQGEEALPVLAASGPESMPEIQTLPGRPAGGDQPKVAEDLPPQGPERLAKIFGAMEPEDAAAVLQKLTDDEIRPILLNMSDRRVAAILENFVPERAASLSRTVLQDRSGTDR